MGFLRGYRLIVMALAIAGAITVVYIQLPRAAFAWSPPTGTSTHPCLRGEGTASLVLNGRGSCFSCSIPPTTPSGGNSEDDKGDDDDKDGPTTESGSKGPITPYAGGNDRRDTGASNDGSTPDPGGGGGLDPHSGAFTAVTSVTMGSGRRAGCLPCGRSLLPVTIPPEIVLPDPIEPEEPVEDDP